MSDERRLRLKEVLHSLATRVPKIILQRVEEVYPALKESLQNFSTIKVENDVLIEENSIDVKTDEVYAPAACSIKEAEPKQNIVAIKVENDVLEENSIDMETDEVYASSACSLNKAEPEQNNVTIKVEDDDMIEENSIDVKTDEVHAPSACSVEEVEPKQYVYTIRIGNAVGIMGEEIASAMQTGDVYALPAYSINEVQPKQNIDAVRVQDAVDIVGDKITTDMQTEEVYTPSTSSISEAKPKICTVFMKDEPGPSSETCNWATTVKAEEDDPLAVPFLAVKAEPGVCRVSGMSSMSEFDELSGTSQFLLSEDVPDADALTNYADYVDNQSYHVDVKDEVCCPSEEREQTPVREEQCDSSDASGDSDSTVPKKRKVKPIKLKDEQLDLLCGWRDCNHRTSSLDQFVRHVSLHVPHLEVKMKEDQEGVYVCLWEHCGFESADSNEIIRHVNFHSYHTKIKCIGSNIMARTKLPVCTLHDSAKNIVPDLPHAFECCWDTCEETFNIVQTYFNHVEMHVYCNPRGRTVEGGVHCQWRGCTSKLGFTSKPVYASIYKLADHVRSHTQEKLVGCPTCGGFFANRAKFSYHCINQVSSELRGYRYPSKKVVQYYQCPYCDKTCPCPSNLKVHIRYRHLDNKPFKCSSCEYRAKAYHDMKQHLNTHRADNLYHCKEEGCDFSCRSAYGLRRHYDKCHVGCDEPQYCCHICDSLFLRGSLLTRHLRTHHSICRPSGHYRFRYKRDKDGLFRLLITDTENVKVTHKVMVLEVGQPLCSNEDEPLTQEAGGEVLSS